MGRSALALVALVAAICPGCLGGSPPPARPDAGHVLGRVALSEAGGGLPGSAGTSELRLVPVPRARLVVTRRTPGKRLTRRLQADARGRFHLSVPPGCYTVVAHIRSSVAPGAGVYVRSGETARVVVTETILVT